MNGKSDAFDEIEAMKNIAEALGGLSEESIRRVLFWASDHFGVDFRDLLSNEKIKSEKMSKINSGQKIELLFENFANLYIAADPNTDAEKVLVAGYWFQEIKGHSEIEAYRINKELKNLGYRIGNMTRAFGILIDARPQLAVQLRKSGTSKQARKTYKITNAGKMKVEGMLARG